MLAVGYLHDVTCIFIYQINFEKKDEKWWEAVLVDEPKISVRKIDASRPMSDLDDEAQAKIEEMVYNDRLKKLGLPTAKEQVSLLCIPFYVLFPLTNHVFPLTNHVFYIVFPLTNHVFHVVFPLTNHILGCVPINKPCILGCVPVDTSPCSNVFQLTNLFYFKQ